MENKNKESAKTYHEEGSKIKRISDAFLKSNLCREENDLVGWSTQLLTILMEISARISPEDLIECDNEIKKIRTRISSALKMEEMKSQGYRVEFVSSGVSVYDLLVNLSYKLQIKVKNSGYAEPTTTEDRGED